MEKKGKNDLIIKNYTPYLGDWDLIFIDTLKKNISSFSFEPCSEKTGLRGVRPGPTQTGLYRRWLEA